MISCDITDEQNPIWLVCSIVGEVTEWFSY